MDISAGACGSDQSAAQESIEPRSLHKTSTPRGKGSCRVFQLVISLLEFRLLLHQNSLAVTPGLLSTVREALLGRLKRHHLPPLQPIFSSQSNRVFNLNGYLVSISAFNSRCVGTVSPRGALTACPSSLCSRCCPSCGLFATEHDHFVSQMPGKSIQDTPNV